MKVFVVLEESRKGDANILGTYRLAADAISFITDTYPSLEHMGTTTAYCDEETIVSVVEQNVDMGEK